MRTRTTALPTLLILIAFSLTSCIPSSLYIDPITHSPEFPAQGDTVVFTLNYGNSSTEEALSDVTLKVRHDPGLIFEYSNSQSQPDRSDEQTWVWYLGELQAGEMGSLEIGFKLAEDIPSDAYQLTISATINGVSSQGSSSEDTEEALTYIEGHATPTATPPPVVQEYEYELGQVSIEIPWQNSGAPIHSEMLDFDSGLLEKPVNGEYDVAMPIIHLAVFDEGGNIVNEFAPPIILRVQYDLEALRAESTDNLAILIFDSNSETWITYAPDFPESEGPRFAVISIYSWTSPATWGCKGCAR